MLEPDAGQGRDASLEREPVGLVSLVRVVGLGAPVRVEAEAVAHQDPVVVGAARYRAKRSVAGIVR